MPFNTTPVSILPQTVPTPAQAPIQQPQPVQTAPPVQPVTNIQTPLPQPMPTAQTQPPQQKPNTVQVLDAIVLKKPKSFGRWDTFTGVMTTQQFIVAQMTSEMLKTATNEAKEQAKAQGKGFFGQWSDQLKASFGYTKRYLNMDPTAILAETPGNFAIENSTIKEIKLKLKHISGNDNYREWEVEIHSTISKYEFKMDENSQFVEALKKAYPDRVKLPIGYFSKTININI
jgi:hypothetical protein